MKRLPMKAKTLTNKIRNYFGHSNMAEELADLVETNWEDLVENWPSENRQWFSDFAKKYHFSTSHLFRNTILILL